MGAPLANPVCITDNAHQYQFVTFASSEQGGAPGSPPVTVARMVCTRCADVQPVN